MDKECLECGYSGEEVEFNLDEDYCDDCFPKVMKEFDQAAKELNKYWRDTRL